MPAKVQIDIEGNTTKLANEMKKLRSEAKAMAWEMKTLEDVGKKNTTAYKQLDSALMKTGAEIKKLGRLSRGTSSEVKRSFHQMLETAENLTTVLYGVGFAMRKMGEQISGVVMVAAEVETLGVVTTQLGKNIGKTKSQMDSYVQGVKKMGITSRVSAQVIARMVQANLDLSKSQQLARISQDAAVIGMTDSSEAMKNIIHAISTLQPKVLKQYGLGTDLNEVYRQYKVELGGVSRELTQSEKKTALLNEILRKGETITGTYEAAMETAGKKILSFKRYTEEAKVELGNHFLPAASTAIDVMTWLTKKFTDSEKPIQLTAGAIALVGGNITTLLPLIASMKLAFGGAFLAWMGKAALAVGFLAARIWATYDAISKLIEAANRIPDIVTGKRSLTDPLGEDEGTGTSPWGLGKDKWGVDLKLLELRKLKTAELKKETGELQKQSDIKKKDKTGGRTGKGGQSQDVTDKQEELNLLVLAGVELKKIQETIDANLTNVGAMVDLRKQELELIQKMEVIEKGREIAQKITRFKGSQSGAMEGVLLGGISTMPEPDKLLEMKTLMDAVDSSVIALGGSLSNLFAAMAQGGQDAMEGLKVALKSIVSTFITAVQGMIIAAAAAMSAKAITSFGLTMISDAPLLALAWAGLEAAKGVISGLATGGTAEGGTPYIVGEKGAELFIPSQTGTVVSNENLMNMLSTQNQPVVNNYFRTEGDYVRILEDHMPSYEQRKLYKR